VHLKEEHFKTSRETLYLDLDTAQHEAQTAKDEVKRINGLLEQREKEVQSLQKQIKTEYGRAVAEYQDNLKTSGRNIESLRQDVNRLQGQVQELEAILFALDVEEEYGEPVDLNALRGVIVGGKDRWHARMKEVLPDTWRFISLDSDIDLSVIAGADIVFFFTGYLNHAVYYAVIGEARRRNIPVGYLKRINDAECLEEIQYGIRKQGLTL
jgi:gas vesicle protein